jgi:flavin reductase (DIM6/NTAB) family NADH-FMN oxidoreductase RutF
MTIESSSFKYCLSHFAKGVTVITCHNPHGENIGLTVDSFNSVSLNPPLILFSINKLSLSHEILVNTPHFLINILSAEQSSLSKNFSSRHPNKWENVSYTLSPKTSNRIIDNCLFYLECENYAVYPGGDHSIILGKVINLEQVTDLQPLVYFKGHYNQISP